MSKYNITFKIHDICVPIIQREHDIHIMDNIIKHQSKYKQSRIQINQINYYTLYLQALTISDITDATGTHIDPMKLKVKPNHTSSTTTDIEFNQGKPDKKAWGTFRKYIRKFTNHKGKLNKPLGKWILPLSKQIVAWSAYLSKN